MMNWKKSSAVLMICTSMLCNTMFLNVVAAQEITRSNMNAYDPFADDEVVVEDNLTMKERLAKIKEEERQKISGSTIDGVLPGHVYIPKGTKLKVELVNAANSKTHKKNQEVDIKIIDNLIVNGVVVIPKDTLGKAYVYEAQKAGGFGRKGVLKIAGKEIKTVNNIAVPLKKGIIGMGNTDGGAVAVAAAVSLVGGLFMKGSNIDYPAGTDFEVEVRENVDLQATQENLEAVMTSNVPHGIEIQVATN